MTLPRIVCDECYLCDFFMCSHVNEGRSDGKPSERAHCAGRVAVAHDRTPMVDGVCPVCGETEGRSE